jgi:hypothetical protein
MGGMIMELYPEMNEKVKDILRVGGEPYLLYAAEYIERLEKERDLAIAGLKQAADDNGGCWGCKWLDEETDECTSPEGRLMCDTKTNNMWEWKGL